MKKIVVFTVLVFSVFARAQDKSPLESYRIDTHYGPRVSVLKSIYDKDSKFQFKAGVLASPYSSLYSSYGAQVGTSYFWNSRWGWDILHGKYFKSSLSSFLGSTNFDSNRTNTSIEIPSWNISSGIHWSPVYAKLQMTQQNLIHFDFYTGLGMSWSQNDIRNLDFDLVENRQAYGAYLKTGFRIWLPPRWSLEF